MATPIDLFVIGEVMELLKPLWHVGKTEEALVNPRRCWLRHRRSSTLPPDVVLRDILVSRCSSAGFPLSLWRDLSMS